MIVFSGVAVIWRECDLLLVSRHVGMGNTLILSCVGKHRGIRYTVGELPSVKLRPLTGKLLSLRLHRYLSAVSADPVLLL